MRGSSSRVEIYPPDDNQQLMEAVALQRVELFSGCFGGWIVPEWQQLARLYHRALGQVLAYAVVLCLLHSSQQPCYTGTPCQAGGMVVIHQMDR
jgi:hypothetical protein